MVVVVQKEQNKIVSCDAEMCMLLSLNYLLNNNKHKNVSEI